MNWKPVRFLGKIVLTVKECGECHVPVSIGSWERHDACIHDLTHIFEVQTGRGSGAYKTRYAFPQSGDKRNPQAYLYYSCLNTNLTGGHKKRLRVREVLTGNVTVLERLI